MRDNSREAGWIFFDAVVLFCLIVIGIVIGSMMSKADADEVGVCVPFDPGFDAVMAAARASDSFVVVVTPPQMPGFIEGLGDKGKGVKGESALAMFTSSHKFAVFVKRGPALCLALKDDGIEGTDL